MLTDTLLLAERLGIPAHELAGLSVLSAAQMESLRLSAEERLERTGRNTFKKLAAASKLVPSGLNARIAESRLGPMVTASMAAHLDPKVAAKIAKKLSPSFVADLMPHLFGGAFADIMVHLPEELVVDVVRLVDQRGQHLLLAILVESLPAVTAAKLVSELSGEGVLQVVRYIRDPQLTADVLSEIPADQREALMAKAFQ